MNDGSHVRSGQIWRLTFLEDDGRVRLVTTAVVTRLDEVDRVYGIDVDESASVNDGSAETLLDHAANMRPLASRDRDRYLWERII